MAFLSAFTTILATSIKAPNAFPWEWLILGVFDFIVNYGWRILVFTVVLKLVLSPLDLFQRYKMRKNQIITKRLEPQIEKLQKAYGHDKGLFTQKQFELQRREGYSLFAPCLPMLVTIILLIWLFASLNTISQYMNLKQYAELYDVYVSVEAVDGKEKAQDAVAEYYKENSGAWSFLWVKNMWSPDVFWVDAIKNKSDFITAAGDYAKKPSLSGITRDELNDMLALYDDVTEKLRADKDTHMNGNLILVILAVGLSMLSQLVMQRQQRGMTPATADGTNPAAGQMKIFMFLMPILMGWFALTSSGVFTLYIVVNSAITLLISLTITYILKTLDRRREIREQTAVQAYGRPDPKRNKK